MLLYTLSLLALQLSHSCTNADLDEQGFLENETALQQRPAFHHHVPARHVSALPVDPVLRRKFLELFQVPANDPKREGLRQNMPPSLIDPSMIDMINQLGPQKEFFYSFAPRHVRARQMLENEFRAQSTATDVYNVAKNVLERGEVNRKVWFYALLGTMLSRPDLNGYHLAWSLDATPDLYITNSVLNSAISGQRVGGDNKCAVYHGTRGTTPNENRLWYFREDAMVNQHHWYWHQYFPLRTTRHADRRGEVFYFMHHNVMARYNAERLSNKMNMVSALDLRLGGNIGVGYNSDLIDKQSEKFWTPRQTNVRLNNINHINDPDFQLDINTEELAQLLNTLIVHIRLGYLQTKNSTHQNDTAQDIRTFEGINHLGNTLEAVGNLSLHPDVYHPHGLHNLLHILIALSADQDFNMRLPAGVMSDPSVAMRDPAFYKVHSLVDDIFDIHKRTLRPYQLSEGEWPLIWEGVTITNLKIVSAAEKRPNSVTTFWSTHKFPLEQGIDGCIHNGDVNTEICHMHLNHNAFTFLLTVDVNNQATTASGKGTVRIFMAPRNNSNGRRFKIRETRKLMFQLDSFPVNLNRGRNLITRHSVDSSSTKPWSRSLQQMLQDPENGGKAEYCGCGWPNHLYVPKGNEQGMEFDLFAMITSFDEDQVQDTAEDLNIPEPCHSAHLFCGIPYRKFPDKRPMGYPFDRLPYSTRQRPLDILEDYVSHVPNMESTVVTIQHVDILV